MWWSRLACVLVARDDSTLLTRALKWILPTTLAVFFPVLSTTALDCCPVDTSSSKTARQHTQLVPRRTGSKPLPRFHCQRPAASKFTRLEPLGLPCLGGNVGGLSQAPSETENDRRTEGSPAGNLGQPTSGTNRQSCQRVLKATEGLCCSRGWTFQTLTVTAMS